MMKPTTFTFIYCSVLAAMLLSAVAATAFAGGGGGEPHGAAYAYRHTTVDSSSVVVQSTASSAAPGAESAGLPASSDGWSASGERPVAGKTRAQVRAELLQAWKDGLLPWSKLDYPPSAETMARNRARFEQMERASKSNGPLTTATQ